MSLIYVKGTPSSGKSAIKQELEAQGYEAHDVDDADMGGPYNNATNKLVEYPDNPTEEWFSQHSYRLMPDAIQGLHDRARDKTIFQCGNANNEDELRHLFDQVIFLDVSWDVIKERLAKRKDNDYGKALHELLLIKEKYDINQSKKYKPKIAIVDANKPLDVVIELVIDRANKSVSVES